MQMRRPSIPVQKFQKWNNPQSGQVHYTYAPAGGITWLRVVFRPLFLFAPFIIGPSYAWLRKHSVTHRTAIPPASRRHLRTCGECVKIYAASSCVSDFSWRRMSNGKRLRCVALRHRIFTWWWKPRIDPLEPRDNYSATSNNMKLVHWLLTGVLRLVERGGDWAGPQPAKAPPRCTKHKAHPSTASVPITILLYNGPMLCGFNVPIKG